MKSTTGIALSAILVLSITVLASCSKDDDPAGPDGGGTFDNPDDARVNLVVNDVVLPLMQHVFVGGYLNPAAIREAGDTRACEPLGICSSGGGQVCVDPGSFMLSFSTCQVGTATLDGTVSLTRTAGSGSGTISLSLGGSSAGVITLEGALSYESDETCFGQYITDAVITTPNLTINMAGAASWCEPYTMIGGTVIPDFVGFEFVIPSLDRLIDVTVSSEPPGGMEIVVLNANRTVVLRVCHGTFTRGDLSCFAASAR